MKIRVLFFGQLKDVIGRSEDAIDLPAGSRVETVFAHYASQYPRLREMADSIAVARNQEFSDSSVALEDGDEIALMPPVSGGSSLPVVNKDADTYFAITADPIDSAALVQHVQSDGDGALITFEGVVRNNSKCRTTRYLDYECYVPLALKTIEDIGREVLSRHEVHRIAIVHRVGRLEIREVSVSIVVASAHRRAAYDASLEAINTVKKRVPVWKKEYFEDGEVWVEGQWDDNIPRSVGTASMSEAPT